MQFQRDLCLLLLGMFHLLGKCVNYYTMKPQRKKKKKNSTQHHISSGGYLVPFEILKARSLDNRGWSNFPRKQFSQNLQMICELLGYHLLTSVAFTNRPTHFVVPTSLSAFKHLMSFFESIIERHMTL